MGAPAALADTSDSPVTDSWLTSSSPLRFEDGLSVFVPLDFFERVRPVFAGPTDWVMAVSTGSGTVLSRSLDSLASASAPKVSAVLSRSLATEASLCESSTPVTDSSSSSPSALLRRDASVFSDVRGAIGFCFARQGLSDSQRPRDVGMMRATRMLERRMLRFDNPEGSQERKSMYGRHSSGQRIECRGRRWSIRDRLSLPRRWYTRMCMSLTVKYSTPGQRPKLLPRTLRPAARPSVFFGIGCTEQSRLFYIKN
jgi:hypothetical protein